MKDRVNGISDEDMVYYPPHYTVGGYEALDVIRAKLSPEEWQGAMKFNVLKYLMRANYKGHHDQDCEKALFYMKELSDAIKGYEDCTLPKQDEIKVREKGCDFPYGPCSAL